MAKGARWVPSRPTGMHEFISLDIRMLTQSVKKSVGKDVD